MEETRICSNCSQEKQLKQFYQNGKSENVWCRKCVGKARREHSITHPHQRTKRQLRNRAYFLRTKYGLTEQQRQVILESQNNCCAICGENFIKTPAVDHTEKEECIIVRGLLCSSCNTGLGCFRDSPDRLLKAINYLENNLNFVTKK